MTSDDFGSSPDFSPCFPPNHNHCLKLFFAHPGVLDLACDGLFKQSIEEVLSQSPEPIQTDESTSPEQQALPLPQMMTMDDYTTSLLQEIGHSPAKSTSLTSLVMVNFLRQCFHTDLTLVDFPRSLVGLEYLEELEARRKRSVAAALSKLGISRPTLMDDARNLAKKYPSFAKWVKGLDAHERKAEALYTQLYVALRRWILLNEFCLDPFKKYNCIAMLNLLFPLPCHTSTCIPTAAYLTAAVLHDQRELYLKQIDAIEAKGLRVVKKMMEQGKREGETTGWPAVRETLHNYLRLANKLINEAQSIDDFGAFEEDHRGRPSADGVKKRKDSGVSFEPATKNKPSPKNCSSSNNANKPLPTTPAAKNPGTSAPPKPPPGDAAQLSSTMDKLTCELRKLRFRNKMQPDSNANIQIQRAYLDLDRTGYRKASGNTTKSVGLSSSSPNESRKLGSPNDEIIICYRPDDYGRDSKKNRRPSRSQSKGRPKLTKAQEEADAFNRDEMRRQRAIWEARNHHWE